MKKLLSTGIILIIVCGVLTGCGTSKDADTNTLFVEKNNSIVEVSVGDFDKDYYDKDEFKDYVKEAVADYKEEDGVGTVKFKKLSVEDKTAKLNMQYSDYKAYSAFVGEEVFVGTVVQALAEGYEFDADFTAVEDGKLKDAVAQEDVVANDDYKVVVVTKPIDVAVHGTITYVSDGVEIKDKKTATVTELTEAGYGYIIYK